MKNEKKKFHFLSTRFIGFFADADKHYKIPEDNSNSVGGEYQNKSLSRSLLNSQL